MSKAGEIATVEINALDHDFIRAYALILETSVQDALSSIIRPLERKLAPLHFHVTRTISNDGEFYRAIFGQLEIYEGTSLVDARLAVAEFREAHKLDERRFMTSEYIVTDDIRFPT